MKTTKIQKLGEDLIIILPKELCEELDITENMLMDIEPFMCGGSTGIRIKKN